MNSTTLTLYDFLNHVVIGALMLLACNITPYTTNEWFYFMLAYIVGLIVTKLHEKTYWWNSFRNPNCLIQNANIKLKRTKADDTKNQYYKNYYRVFKHKVNENISILEAQFAFLMNLMIPMIVFIVMFSVCKDRLIIIFSKDNYIINECNCCCQLLHTTNNVICVCPLALSVIILGFFAILDSFFDCYKDGVGQCCCLGCGMLHLILILLFVVLSFCFFKACIISVKEKQLLLQRIGSTLAVSFLLLPYLAYNIQRKISILVVEAGYYLKDCVETINVNEK